MAAVYISVSPTLLLALILGQAVPAPSPHPDVERIRKALAEAPPALVAETMQIQEKPVFRVLIEHRQEPPIWLTSSMRPGYVQTYAPAYHHEFLNEVTPEYWKASTLYPVGVPVGTLIRVFIKSMKEQSRRHRETAARAEVRAAIAELDNVRRTAGLSGIVVPRN